MNPMSVGNAQHLPLELDAALHAYVDGVRHLFGDHLIGIYCHGSLAYGAFEAATSDVDLVVVYERGLTAAQQEGLAALHTRLLSAHPAVARLDVTYAPLDAIGTDGRTGPIFRDGHLVVEGRGDLNAVTRHTLRTRGLALYGPPPLEIVPPASLEDLRATMRYNIAFLRHRMPAYVWGGTTPTVFGVLTLCRVLYTLRTGQITGKRAAGEWALGQVATPWRPFLRRALTRYNRPDGVDLVLAAGAIPFVTYIARLAQDMPPQPESQGQ